MYHFVREHLRTKEGRCTRSDLLDAMHGDGRIATRLNQSQGFDALLRNMVHSREIELEGDNVVASLKALRRRRIVQPAEYPSFDSILGSGSKNNDDVPAGKLKVTSHGQ